MQDSAPDSRALFNQAGEALRAGDPARGAALLKRALAANPNDVSGWLNLAVVQQRLGDAAGELTALEEALKREPRNLAALLFTGAHYDRAGRPRKAAEAYAAALQVAPRFEMLPNELKPAVRRAVEVSRQTAVEREAFVREHVRDTHGRLKGAELHRFEEALEVVLGKKAIFRQQPQILFWPGLPAIQFFQRKDFPYLDAVEAATDDIKGELLEVLKLDEGLVPYIDYPEDKPLDQWRDLNRSPDWSAYHLMKDGVRIEEHCARCPKTMAALAHAPSAEIPGHSPVAMFSVLKPHTRIPPHTGVTNVRLVVHLPLIVPEKCGFRVGNDTREWIPGQTLLFDDTIEHEAWNDSDKVRVVLIYDIWNPYLNEAERELAATLVGGLDAFNDEGAA